MSRVEIVEVGPRDGFQNIGPFIPTSNKLGFICDLSLAGVRRIEATSFVSSRAIPQLADAREVLGGALKIDGLITQVLVPNSRNGQKALLAGARFLSYVVSVSESHNRANVLRSPADSLSDFQNLRSLAPNGTRMRFNVATAFHCPFEGTVAVESVLRIVHRALETWPDAEICLCDTTGRGEPLQVAALFKEAMLAFPAASAWAMHAHDTFGHGLENACAAYEEGVRIFDAAIGGLGGCPYAPGASGNVATEKLVRCFEERGIQTGLDLARLEPIAAVARALPGANCETLNRSLEGSRSI
ncbi:hydroxymethylglutaryl-CoA lyase [Sphingomonas sp. ZB1N12]|uniref:hydroxymethylglutaryl-CoA lyase n=1 Tax=Sphingomonas arabinosi TaxID=3096160 RepID=UPI003B78846A